MPYVEYFTKEMRDRRYGEIPGLFADNNNEREEMQTIREVFKEEGTSYFSTLNIGGEPL